MTATEDFVDSPRHLAPSDAPVTRRARTWMPTGRAADAVAGAAFLATALYVTSSLWSGLRDRVVAGYGTQDQMLMEWFLAHAARSVTHLQNPLFTHQLDAPYGVNMMAQTNVLGLGLPMTPVTLAFGPRVAFAALLVLALAGTAYAWYHVLSRNVVSSRSAAFIGAALCGFAPGMISESLGHLQMVSQFLIPFIVLEVLRLGETGRWWRHGVILGLLMAYQVLISEEVLFFVGLSVGLFLLVYVLLRRSELRAIRRFAAGAAMALGVTGVILAYPLFKQFLGARHYRGLPFPPSLIYVDLASYIAFPSNSLAGTASSAARLAHTTAEETSFFGWPLILVVLGMAVWLWLRGIVLARAVAICGLTFALLSLGYTVMVNGRRTIPGPFSLIGHLPLFDLVVSARLALVVVPFVGILLALGYDHAIGAAPPAATGPETVGTGPETGATAAARRAPRVRRYLVLAAIIVAVLPILPLPLPTTTVPASPHFISAGGWRTYVPSGRTLVTVPTTSSFAMDGMRWGAESGLDFAIPRGYFLGPGETSNSLPLYGAVPTWTSIVLDQVAITGQLRPRQPGDDALLLTDLRTWRAAVLVLSPSQRHADALRATIEQFLGPAKLVDDVWLWDLRGSIS